MTRAVAIAIICAFRKNRVQTIDSLTRETLTHRSNISDWLHALEVQGVVKILGTQRPEVINGKKKKKGPLLWEWQDFPPSESP